MESKIKKDISFFNTTIGLVTLSILYLVFILVISWKDLPYYSPDSHWYIQLSQGNNDEVIKPFSFRILHPYIASTISQTFGLSIDTSFFIIAVTSFLILSIITTSIIIYVTPNPSIAVFLLFSYFLFSTFRDYYLPDLFYAVLLSIFFYFLLIDKFWIALCILLILHFTRESTILLDMVLFSVNIYKHKYKFALITLIVMIVGVIGLSYFGNLGQSNIHQTNTLIYSVLKVIYNFAKNILGIELWTDTLAAQAGLFPEPPLLIINLPTWIPAGAIDKVGIYSFDLNFPVATFTILLTLFGIAPFLLIVVLLDKKKSFLVDIPMWLLVASIYGLTAFIIGPLLGASVQRLIGYGWPLFWIVFPYILGNYFKFSNREQTIIYICTIAICWMPYAFEVLSFNQIHFIFILVIVVLLYYFFIKHARIVLA